MRLLECSVAAATAALSRYSTPLGRLRSRFWGFGRSNLPGWLDVLAGTAHCAPGCWPCSCRTRARPPARGGGCAIWGCAIRGHPVPRHELTPEVDLSRRLTRGDSMKKSGFIQNQIIAVLKWSSSRQPACRWSNFKPSSTCGSGQGQGRRQAVHPARRRSGWRRWRMVSRSPVTTLRTWATRPAIPGTPCTASATSWSGSGSPGGRGASLRTQLHHEALIDHSRQIAGGEPPVRGGAAAPRALDRPARRRTSAVKSVSRDTVAPVTCSYIPQRQIQRMRIRRGFAEAIGAIETGRVLVQRIHQQHAHT